MGGFGNQYHPFTATSTLILFGLFAALNYGPMYTPIPGIVSLAVLPLNMLHSFTVGQALGIAGVTIPVIGAYLNLLTYYLVALIFGYIHHSRSNSMGGF